MLGSDHLAKKHEALDLGHSTVRTRKRHGELFARASIRQRTVAHCQPCANACGAKQRIEHAVRLVVDLGAAERAFRIARGLDDAVPKGFDALLAKGSTHMKILVTG